MGPWYPGHMRKVTIAMLGLVMLGWLTTVHGAAEPTLPIRYLQRFGDGSYRVIARFVDSRACEKYRAMQAQIVCVTNSVCRTSPDSCRGRVLSTGPISCWQDVDLGPGFGRCEESR